MSEMTSVEQQQQQQQHQQQQQQQQQYVSGSSNHEHHCKDCGLYFESDKSLEVHLRYHQDNLLSQWATQAQQEESNNNNSKAGNHNNSNNAVGHGIVVTKRESVSAPADSSEPSSRPPSEGPAPSSQQQQQQQQNTLQRGQQQQQPPPSSGVQNYGGGHFQSPMFSETSYFMQNDASYILPQHYSPNHDDTSNNGSVGNYTRYHPYQHQQHFPGSGGERANSVSSTSPRSPPLQCDKCGSVFEDAIQLNEHVRVNHTTSPGSYTGQAQFQQLGGSPQTQQQQQQQQQQMHTSPSQSGQQSGQGQQQQTGYDYNGGRSSVKNEVKQEPEEQAEILDLDSHKVQTHRYEEELMRLHQQEMQMQLHQQQQQQQQQQHVIPHQQQSQQQQQPPRGGPHSVSSMLGWPPAQPHEYHPGLSPMGPIDSVSPVPDQSQFMRGQHIPVEPPRHPGSPIITSTQSMPNHQLSASMLQQPQKPSGIGNQSWKSNEARRPKTYNCTACNKWFTSSGHLKRHYNTTLHKNAVKQSNMPDPANMPISAHHHPGRDQNLAHGGRGGGGASRSPELSTSGSPPNLMAGPSGEAARGLLNTPTNLYTTSNSSNGSNSNSSDSSPVVQAQQQQQQQTPSATTIHMGSSMSGLNSPVPSPMGSHHQHHHHQQQMGSSSPQLIQHPLSIGSPSQLVVHHPMSSPMSPMQPPPPPHHLNSPTQMGSLHHHHHHHLHNQHHGNHHHHHQQQHQSSHHHHTSSSLPIMAGVPPMVSPPPPMGGTSMPHQPYPNALPPHVTITTSIPGLLESITSQLITTGNEIPQESQQHHQEQQQQSQDLVLPGFGSFSDHQRPLPNFTQLGIGGFLLGHNQPQAVNVGGLSPEDVIPQERSSFVASSANYDSYRDSPPRYESLTSMEIDVSSQPNDTDGMIIKQYDVHQHHHHHHQQQHLTDDHEQCNSIAKTQLSEEQQREIETNNNVPQRQGKEEINPNIVKKHRQPKKNEKKTNDVITKEHQVTSTNTGSHYISQGGFHKCIQCNKVFNKACYLTQHNKSFHSGDKPFKCNQCGKRFPLEYLHAEHLQKHAGEKPYKCEICPKQFNHKTDLRRHMCLHTGEKPYACDNCGKGFIRKDHMMKHLETHKKKLNNHHNLHLRA